MSRRLALAALLLVPALDAHAAGMAIRWNSCLGASNRNFACDRSTGSEVLVGSFSAPTSVRLSGLEVYVRITAADGDVPHWWQMFGGGTCRQSSISTAFDVSGETECDDPWLGQAAGGIGAYSERSPANWPGTGQATGGIYLKMAVAVPVAAIQTVSPGRTYAGFRLMINHSRSHGPAACEGCSQPVCITVEQMVLTNPEKKPIALTDGIAGMGGAANVVTWQGGTPNCGAGAAKPSTWSELKRRFK
jgi:hypothetical protein